MPDQFVFKFGVIRDGKNYIVESRCDSVRDMAEIMRACAKAVRLMTGDSMIEFMAEFEKQAQEATK